MFCLLFYGCISQEYLEYLDETNQSLIRCSNDLSGEVVIPSEVKEIHKNALYNCKFVTCIDETSFFYSNISSIVLHDRITEIRKVTKISSTLCGLCTSLIKVTISENVVEIEDNAFAHCYSLIRIKIPKNVILIGKNAFYDCINLTTIKLMNINKHIC